MKELHRRLNRFFDLVDHDERTDAVLDRSGRGAYFFLFMAILLDANYRIYLLHDHPWDLGALVFASLAVFWVCSARQKILVRGWGKKVLLLGIIGGVFGAVVGIIISIVR